MSSYKQQVIVFVLLIFLFILKKNADIPQVSINYKFKS
jgi:hypothetical protein